MKLAKIFAKALFPNTKVLTKSLATAPLKLRGEGRSVSSASHSIRGAAGDVLVGVSARSRFAGGHFLFFWQWYAIPLSKKNKIKDFARACAADILRPAHPKVGILEYKHDG